MTGGAATGETAPGELRPGLEQSASAVRWVKVLNYEEPGGPAEIVLLVEAEAFELD